MGIKFLIVVETVVLLLPLGTVNRDDYGGDLLLAYIYSVGGETLFENDSAGDNSVGDELLHSEK